VADVVLLDFTQPPPGYTWDERRRSSLRDIYDDLVGPLAEAWTHYKARFDPPGMFTRVVAGTYAKPAQSAVWGPFFEHAGRQYNLVFEVAGATPVEQRAATARAAAWRWYEARAELYGILRKLNPPREFWPVLLTWLDEQVAEVNQFLTDNADVIMFGAADGLTFPEVLR